MAKRVEMKNKIRKNTQNDEILPNSPNNCVFDTPNKDNIVNNHSFELWEDSLNIQKYHSLTSAVKIKSDDPNKNGNFDVCMIKGHNDIVKKYINSFDISDFKNDTTKASGQSIEFKFNSNEKLNFREMHAKCKSKFLIKIRYAINAPSIWRNSNW